MDSVLPTFIKYHMMQLKIVFILLCLAFPCYAEDNNLSGLFRKRVKNNSTTGEVSTSSSSSSSVLIRESSKEPRHIIEVEEPQMDVGSHKNEKVRLCPNDRVCRRGQFCDLHYNVCRPQVGEGDPCRRDEMCQRTHYCMYGKCQLKIKRGEEGARCHNQEDCPHDMCCARRHGQQVCQRRLRLGDRCYVPDGGLEFSINEICPCEVGLACKYAHDSRSFHLSPIPSQGSTQVPSQAVKDPPPAFASPIWVAFDGMRCFPPFAGKS